MPITINGTGPIDGITSLNTTVSSTELGYLDGTTSAIQTQINSKANSASPTFTGNATIPYDLSTGGTNIVDSRTITDSSSVNIYNVQNASGMFFVYTGQATAIPFYANGGAGVAYRWTVLDPDTGWNINWNGTFSFAQAGSGTHTFTIGFASGSGLLSIQRTAGTGSYNTKLMIWGVW